MRQANFNAGSDLYIASGLLTYGANDGEPGMLLPAVVLLHDLCIKTGFATSSSKRLGVAEMMHLIATLKELGLCKSAHYKELHLPQKEIDGTE